MKNKKEIYEINELEQASENEMNKENNKNVIFSFFLRFDLFNTKNSFIEIY